MFRNIKDSLMQALFTLLALYLIYLLLRYPEQSLSYASTGLVLWFQKMIPTLFPFMVVSGIMIRMNLTERFVRFFHPLFHKIWGTSPNGSYVVLMGMLCGFPMGARVIGQLCRAGKLSEQEGAFLLAFCNNIGPIYFISFVMSTLSLSGNYAPFFIMYGVPLCYGAVLYRIGLLRKKAVSFPAAYFQAASRPNGLNGRLSFWEAADEAIVSGLIGIGKLGGYMVFFNLLNIMMFPFSALPQRFLSFSNCILEITSGISRAGKNEGLMVLILLPFGGLSCMAQTYSMIKETNLSITRYVWHKCVQTALTASIYAAFSGVSYYFLK
ncbi:MAG: hypothetical protein NC231_14100 [Bacillus sp. (in: Bacteria)]|nr:hypothetical protein [Bacillus sp. (in: firmicutes)]MCM1425919.1 hypothetical protein [Eubacterium sp.]